eukprot:290896-Amphidinium_carterae.1
MQGRTGETSPDQAGAAWQETSSFTAYQAFVKGAVGAPACQQKGPEVKVLLQKAAELKRQQSSKNSRAQKGQERSRRNRIASEGSESQVGSSNQAPYHVGGQADSVARAKMQDLRNRQSPHLTYQG